MKFNDRYLRLGSLIFVIVGVVILLVTSYDNEQARDAGNWPLATGVIEVSNIEVVENTKHNGEYKTTYKPVIKYIYTVNDHHYSGNRVSIINHSLGKDINALIKKYPVGKSVDVIYNPDRPAYSALEIGRLEDIYLPYALGAILLIFGISAFIPVRKK